jgi:hypothetical protein
MLATFESTMSAFFKSVTRDILDRSTVPGGILYGVIFAFAAWLLGSALRVAVQRALANDKHERFDLMAVKFLAKLARYGVYLFAFVAYARFVPFLSGFGAASLASISVMSVIIGFAAQNTLGNLIAGLSLLLYRPFKLGDRLQVTAPTGLETGFVESLTLGYTLGRQPPGGAPQQPHGQPDGDQSDHQRPARGLLGLVWNQSRIGHRPDSLPAARSGREACEGHGGLRLSADPIERRGHCAFA